MVSTKKWSGHYGRRSEPVISRWVCWGLTSQWLNVGSQAKIWPKRTLGAGKEDGVFSAEAGAQQLI